MSGAHFAEKRDLLSVRRPRRPGFPSVGLRQASRNVTMNGLNPDRVRAVTGSPPTEWVLVWRYVANTIVNSGVRIH
jgi:hypothetical protein